MSETPEIPEELPLADGTTVSAEVKPSEPEDKAVGNPAFPLGLNPGTVGGADGGTEVSPLQSGTEPVPFQNGTEQALLQSGTEDVAEIHTNETKGETPMLDVHDPHESIHTWKDFWIHLGTIAAGLLIAIGLEQGVEALHRQHQLRVLQEDLRQETLTNRDWGQYNLAFLDRDMNWLLELRRRVDAVREGGDKNLFVYPAPPAGFPGDPNHTDRRLQAVTVWNTARENAQVDLLPTTDAHMYTTFYRVSDLYSDNFTVLTVDWRKLTGFEFQFEGSWVPSEPDIRRMSPQQLDQYAEIIGGLFLEARMVRRYLQIQMAYNEAAVEHRTFPDIERYLQGHPNSLQGSSSGVVPVR